MVSKVNICVSYNIALLEAFFAELILNSSYWVLAFEVAFSRAAAFLNLLLLYLSTVRVPLFVTFVTERGDLFGWLSHRNFAAKLTLPFFTLLACVMTMLILASLAEVILLLHSFVVSFLSFDRAY
jgi:hypothetical protein